MGAGAALTGTGAAFGASVATGVGVGVGSGGGVGVGSEVGIGVGDGVTIGCCSAAACGFGAVSFSTTKNDPTQTAATAAAERITLRAVCEGSRSIRRDRGTTGSIGIEA